MTHRLTVLFILLGLSVAAAGDSQAQGNKIPISYRETAQFVAEGAAKGMAFSAVVAAQHAKALSIWKRLFAEDNAPHVETPHFLVYGVVPGKTLREAGANLEKQYGLALKALEMEQTEPWVGKLAVYCLPSRDGFLAFIRALEQRRLDEGDLGTYDIDDDFPYAAGSPPSGKEGLAVDLSAGAQMSAALLSKKAGRTVPEWIQLAFGRATAYRAASAKDLAAEHKRALTYLVKNKRALQNLFPPSTGMTDDEAAVLRASVLEYLAYSGRTAKFVPFLGGFRVIDDTGNPPTFAAGLNAANLTQERLDQVWQAWVRSGK